MSLHHRSITVYSADHPKKLVLALTGCKLPELKIPRTIQPGLRTTIKYNWQVNADAIIVFFVYWSIDHRIAQLQNIIQDILPLFA